jgi:hypothetical protein
MKSCVMDCSDQRIPDSSALTSSAQQGISILSTADYTGWPMAAGSSLDPHLTTLSSHSPPHAAFEKRYLLDCTLRL